MRRARILLVDDNRVNRKLMAAVLEADGYRVEEAGSGREALEGVRLLPYDLVLMDLQMSDMDGFAATAAIRALGGKAGTVPILAVSGDVEDDVVERCLAAGMNGHLAKPVSPTMLQQVVERWVKQPGGEPASLADAAPTAATAVRLGGLASDLSGAALVPIIDDFIAGSTRRMDEIERLAFGGDLSALRRVAHDLSGSAANLGLMEMSRAARAIEVACSEALPDAARRLVPETRATLDRTVAFLATQRAKALGTVA